MLRDICMLSLPLALTLALALAVINSCLFCYRRVQAVIECLEFMHAGTPPDCAEAFLRLAISLSVSNQSTSPMEHTEAILHAVLGRQGLLWEWSRSRASASLRVSACGMLRGLMMELPVPQARAVQQGALDWGGLLHHLRLAVAPTAADGSFSRLCGAVAAELERAAQRRMRPFRRALAAGGVGGSLATHGSGAKGTSGSGAVSAASQRSVGGGGGISEKAGPGEELVALAGRHTGMLAVRQGEDGSDEDEDGPTGAGKGGSSGRGTTTAWAAGAAATRAAAAASSREEEDGRFYDESEINAATLPSELLRRCSNEVVHPGAREASREIVAMVCAGNREAMDVLARCLPGHMMALLSTPIPQPAIVSDALQAQVQAPVHSPAPPVSEGKAAADAPKPDDSTASASTPSPAPVPEEGVEVPMGPGAWITGGHRPSLVDNEALIGVGRPGCLWWDASQTPLLTNREERDRSATRAKYTLFPRASAPESAPVYKQLQGAQKAARRIDSGDAATAEKREQAAELLRAPTCTEEIVACQGASAVVDAGQAWQ